MSDPDRSEIDFVKKIKDRLFSKEALTKGEIIQIILVCFLILIILFTFLSTTCQLDCSMCTDCTQLLTQRGIK